MSALLLAPYNDSMKIGQGMFIRHCRLLVLIFGHVGFNSFLQTPCLYNAVKVANSPVVEKDVVSQTVSYSSRVATSVSDVVGSMNISAGSSIKNGTLFTAGNTQTVDLLKFKESDINVVVSVKVCEVQS